MTPPAEPGAAGVRPCVDLTPDFLVAKWREERDGLLGLARAGNHMTKRQADRIKTISALLFIAGVEGR